MPRTRLRRKIQTVKFARLTRCRMAAAAKAATAHGGAADGPAGTRRRRWSAAAMGV